MQPVLQRHATVITCHAQADWDAFASMIGLSELYPDAVMIYPGSIEHSLSQFYQETAIHLFHFVSLKELDFDAVECVVIADTRQKNRLRHIWPLLERYETTTNDTGQSSISAKPYELHIWDHHPEADPNLVPTFSCIDERIGSTCTLVCQAFEARQQKINCFVATILGVGLYADTGNLSYVSTSYADFMAAAKLFTQGMDLSTVTELVQHTMTARHIRLLNAMLDNLRARDIGSGKLLITQVDMDVFVNDFAVLSQKFMEMENGDVLFALGNVDDKIIVVGRSRIDTINVGFVCKQLGGGGHAHAASASVKNMPLAELTETILRLVYIQVAPGKRAESIMSSPPIGIEEHKSTADAEQLMTRYGLKAVPVFKTDTHCAVGYLEAQTAALAMAHNLGNLPVTVYMQRKMRTVSLKSDLQQLVDIIVGYRQRIVPVVEDEKTLGVVTRTDLITLFAEDPERLPLKSAHSKERELGKLLRARLPQNLLNVLLLAGKLGEELHYGVFAVGGFVRDILLNRPSSECDDVDLVVEGNAIMFAQKLAVKLGGRVYQHPAFLTALIIYHDRNGLEQRLDIATARLEYYPYPAALPSVELSSLKMDLFRRDFTMNAMAIRLNNGAFGRLVDYFGGQDDIRRRVVRVLHALSFVEDPTRILRAVRFEQRYGFRLSGQCEKLIKNVIHLDLMTKISGGRFFHELQLIFHEQMPHASLIRLHKLGVLEAFDPLFTLTASRIERLERLREIRDWYKFLYLEEQPNLTLLYLLVLFSGLKPNQITIPLQNLALPPAIHKQFLRLRTQLHPILHKLMSKRVEKVSYVCSVLTSIPIEGLLYLMAKTHSEDCRRLLSEYTRSWRFIQLEISGQDLLSEGLPQGPKIGCILQEILEAKRDGLVISHEEEMRMARDLIVRSPLDAQSNQSTKPSAV